MARAAVPRGGAVCALAVPALGKTACAGLQALAQLPQLRLHLVLRARPTVRTPLGPVRFPNEVTVARRSL